MPSGPRTRGPRSLAEDLRSRSDDALAALLRERSDLAWPLPAGTLGLAARASTKLSVQRALDRLDTPSLQVLEVVVALPGPTDVESVVSACGADAVDAALVDAAPVDPILADQVRRIVAAAHTTALLWGTPQALRVTRSVADVLGPTPAGLGPPLREALGTRSPSRVADLAADLGLPSTGDPVADLDAVTALSGDPAQLAGLLAGAPAAARDLLAKLTWGPPVGAVSGADRQVRAADATTPLEWLLARGLLVAAGPGHVVLPREVAVALRGGVVLRTLDVEAPPLTEVPARAVASAEAAATARAREAVRLVGVLLEAAGAAPVPILRAGGLGVRELRRVADRLAVEGEEAAFWVELAWAAGLLADDGEADPAWAPTPGYDTWRELDLPARWERLAAAWWRTSRTPGLVGSKDARGGVRVALADDGDRSSAPLVRQAVLADLALLPAGSASTPACLLDRLRWRWPRRVGQLTGDLVAWTLREAEWLGVTGAGALSAPGRALAAGEDAAAALTAVLPTPVDRVVLQADLTAVAPGPLVADVEERLELLADVDSRGAATVYRFTPTSLRRGLDAGSSAEEITQFLHQHSTTPVPQALSVLVADVARRHGRLRVGTATSYLRSDDEAALAEVLADRRAAPLGLRRLAPTVAAARAEPTRVVEVLRAMGMAPALEGPDADVVLAPVPTVRSPARSVPAPVTGDPPTASPDQLVALVGGVRQHDEASSERSPWPSDAERPPALTAVDPGRALAALREAAAGARSVWVGLADASGRTSVRKLTPLDVTAGTVSALDPSTGRVSTVSVHRVTGVATA